MEEEEEERGRRGRRGRVREKEEEEEKRRRRGGARPHLGQRSSDGFRKAPRGHEVLLLRASKPLGGGSQVVHSHWTPVHVLEVGQAGHNPATCHWPVRNLTTACEKAQYGGGSECVTK
jgi:hypothetical protein